MLVNGEAKNDAMRLALDKGHRFGAGQSVMSRLENDILGNASEAT